MVAVRAYTSSALISIDHHHLVDVVQRGILQPAQ
jgi:hypothetical protein